MTSSAFTPLSANGQQRLNEEVQAEKLRSLNIVQYCLVGCAGIALATAAFAAFVPATALFAFCTGAAAASLFPLARGAGEFRNQRELGQLQKSPDLLVDNLVNRRKACSAQTSAGRAFNAGVLSGGFAVVAAGLAGGMLTAAAPVAAIFFGLSLLAQGLRRSAASAARSAARLEDKAMDILDEEAMITPVGSGGKFRGGRAAAPGFNKSADIAEPEVQTEQAISVGRPLQLKKPAALFRAAPTQVTRIF